MNNQSTLVGMFKQVYGDDFINAWGYIARLSKRIKFITPSQRNGDGWNVPVDMQFEHGISYAPAGTTNSGTTNSTTAYVPASPGHSQNAVVYPFQINGRAQVSYESIARSAGAGQRAFEEATNRVVKRLSMAVVKRLEIALLHGQKGIGIIETAAATGGGANAWTKVLTISAASWSAGLFAGFKGASVDVYDTTLVTKRNTNATTAANLKITNIDTVNRQITLTSNATANTDANAIVATDVLFFETGSATSEMPGLDVWSRASSGTLAGINVGTYELFQGNLATSSAGVPTFGKLLEWSSITADFNNAMGLLFNVHPKAFEILNTDQAALREYDVSYKGEKAKNGFQALEFASQIGPLEVLANPFEKQGLIHAFVPQEAIRAGSQDVGFIDRGRDGNGQERLILEVADSTGSEMRCYTGQSLFIEQPRHTVCAAGVTFS